MSSEIEVLEATGAVQVTDVKGGEIVTVLKETTGEVDIDRHLKGTDITVERYGDSHHHREHFRIALDVTLLDVLDEGAKKLNEKLLPDAKDPLDRLRGVYRDHEAGDPLDLGLTLGEFLKKLPVTHHFAIELVLAIQINTRWRVAPSSEMTPRAILELAGLSPEEYSLYFPSTSTQPLPPDTPVKLERGMHFEAQRDGKYGGAAAS